MEILPIEKPIKKLHKIKKHKAPPCHKRQKRIYLILFFLIRIEQNISNTIDIKKEVGNMFTAETAFHLALGVSDLQKARDFYTGILGAKEGRSAPSWVDFNFFGHQLSCHLTEKKTFIQFNSVDKQSVPIPHFGLIVSLKKYFRKRKHTIHLTTSNTL